MQRPVLAAWGRLCALPPLAQDGLLYLASAIFAVLTIHYAVTADYREWGAMAGVAYGVCGVVALSVAGYRRVRENPVLVRRVRGVLCTTLVIGAVLVPLTAELHWRATAAHGAQAQPEVAVIERAGDRVAQSRDPYPLHPAEVGISPGSDAHATDASAYFPYLPGMIPFGLMNALHLPTELTDARVTLVSFSLLIAAVALAVSGSAASRRSRVVQMLIVLPTGALPLVTGGDDLPVLALLFLGFVLGARRRPALCGLVLGLAGTLKFTSWPVLVLMLFAVRDENGRRAYRRYGITACAVLAPALIYGFFSAPGPFLNNAIRFPLGLANLRSPAASPLLGHVLTTLFPADRRAVTAVLGVIGVALMLAYLSRHLPRTVAAVSRTTAIALLIATVLAPATRFGYLIYPANLFVWSYFLAPIEAAASERRQSSSSRSMRRISTELVSAGVPPPSSAGVIAPLRSSMRTPTSQV
jgi:hypothetical protein